MRVGVLLAFLSPLLIIGGGVRAQYLVRDINPGAGHGSPSTFAALGDTVIFRANDGANGVELWKSDGTAAGTVMVKDINPGSAGSSPSSLVVMNGFVYFTANDGAAGIELWRSDGTAAGTTLVADINPGTASSSASQLVVFGNTLIFRATDGANGVELWKTDGTAAGTAMVADINPGSGSSNPSYPVFVGAVLYFTATNGTDGTELWKSLPPWIGASTSMVANINPGAANSSPTYLTPAGPLVFFAADDGANGRELWVSDGTPPGTKLVADINPGSAASSPTSLAFAGPFLFFSADDGASGRELWKSDGTAANTALVMDIRPGATGSGPSSILAEGLRVFFTASDGVSGVEVWQSLPPYIPGTTAMVRDINPGIGDGIPPAISIASAVLLYSGAHNVRILFSGTDGVNGSEPWVTDGTAAGTFMLADLNPGANNSAPSGFLRAGKRVFFMANDGTNGIELFAVNLGRFGGALAEPFGAGCPGTGNQVPQIAGTGLPVTGNTGFGVGLARALPATAALLLLDGAPGALPLGGGCTLYVGLQSLFPFAAVTDASGAAMIPLGIPNTPALVGVSLYSQWAVIDSGGAFAGMACFSEGLHLLIGN